jgi:C-terminal processing protease CtpA/Prc
VDNKKLFETGVSAMLRSLDPYTEFEGRQEAQDLTESVQGKYGGIGLVISGSTLPKPAAVSGSAGAGGDSKIMPKEAVEDARMLDDDTIALDMDDEDLLFDGDAKDRKQMAKEQKKAYDKAMERGVVVVNAFEGYAFDYGMRPGDKIVAVDGWRVEPGTPVEDVRNRLRGDPGSSVDITFVRDRLEGETTLSLPRRVVQIADVKLASMVGKPSDGIGYIQLSGFTADAGREVRNSIFGLQKTAEANGGSLQVSLSSKSFESCDLDLTRILLESIANSSAW